MGRSFRPKKPEGTDEILLQVAIATRIVCHNPLAISEVCQALLDCTKDLQPPESWAAAECLKQFTSFTAKLRTLHFSAWLSAGRDFLEVLETIAQQLDVMPLPAMDKLPLDLPKHLTAPEPITVVSGQGAPVQVTHEVILNTIRHELSSCCMTAPPLVRARLIHQSLAQLPRHYRDELIKALWQDNAITKSEAALLIRWLARQKEVARDEEAAIVVLNRVGDWILAS